MAVLDPWQGASAAGGTLGTLGTLDGTLTHLAAMATRQWWWTIHWGFHGLMDLK